MVSLRPLSLTTRLTVMMPMKALRVATMHVAHPLRQIARRGLEHQMRGVGHQTGGMTQPLHAAADFPPDIQGGLSVAIIQVNIRPTMATGGDMGEGTRQFYAQWSSPRTKYSGVMWQCKI